MGTYRALARVDLQDTTCGNKDARPKFPAVAIQVDIALCSRDGDDGRSGEPQSGAAGKEKRMSKKPRGSEQRHTSL